MLDHFSQILVIFSLCLLTGCRNDAPPLTKDFPTDQSVTYVSPIFQSIVSPLATFTPIFTVMPTSTKITTSTPTPTFTITPSPTPTNTPKPTSTPDLSDEEASRILHNVNWEGGFEDTVIGAVRAMDYLRHYPDSPYRKEILTQVFYTNPPFFRDWFYVGWIDEYIRQPFNREKGMPADFEEQWQNQDMIQVFVADLDHNNVDDFVVVIKHALWRGLSDGRLYWVYGTPGDYQISILPTGEEWVGYERTLYAEVKAIQDLNNDGSPELIYIVQTSGASTAFDAIYILSWENGYFKNIVVGDNVTMNGEWRIEDNDNIFELVKKRGGAGSVGFCCILTYELKYNLFRNEYIPVQQLPGFLAGGERANPGWQIAKMLQHSYRYEEALEYFNTWLERRNLEYYQEAIPYVYFQIGMTRLLMNNVDEANKTWRLLVEDFPEHPVTFDIQDMQPFLQNRNDIWRVCSWLQDNKRDWPLPEDKQVFYRLEADYNHWGDLCDPKFLFEQWVWIQDLSLDEQMAERGLNWHSLSNTFDLNSDDKIDPIGEVRLAGGNQRWVFLTQENNIYQPFFADSPYPVEAIHIWDKFGYDEMSWYVRNRDIRITDVDEDGNPEMRYTYPGGNLNTEWIGHRFEKIDYMIAVDDDLVVYGSSDDKALENILQTLFYEQDFEKTINLLEDYDAYSDTSVYQVHFKRWAEAGGYFLRGLAYSYQNETNLAQQSFSVVIRDYADTSWVDLAREKLAQ